MLYIYIYIYISHAKDTCQRDYKQFVGSFLDSQFDTTHSIKLKELGKFKRDWKGTLFIPSFIIHYIYILSNNNILNIIYEKNEKLLKGEIITNHQQGFKKQQVYQLSTVAKRQLFPKGVHSPRVSFPGMLIYIYEGYIIYWIIIFIQPSISQSFLHRILKMDGRCEKAMRNASCSGLG
jgi:hypothetical protein